MPASLAQAKSTTLSEVLSLAGNMTRACAKRIVGARLSGLTLTTMRTSAGLCIEGRGIDPKSWTDRRHAVGNAVDGARFINEYDKVLTF